MRNAPLSRSRAGLDGTATHGGPDVTFAGVGAPKTGTTALFHWLASHPDVYLPPNKELHFFDGGVNADRGITWYLGQFADRGAATQSGEWATTYLSHPDAVARMAEQFAGLKLVVSLREPVARAWSAYNYGVSRFYLAGRFADLINDELADLLAGRRRASGLITDGLYARHLERAFEFVPRERVHVVVADELRADPAGTFASLCRFLGVDDSWTPPDLGQYYNVTHTARSSRLHSALARHDLYEKLPARLTEVLTRLNVSRGYADMPRRQRDALAQLFALENARLGELLGLEVDRWAPSLPFM